MVRSLIICILTWVFLCSWELLAEPDTPKQYVAAGEFIVGKAKVHRTDGPGTIAAKAAILQSHIAAFKRAELRSRAEERVRLAHPEMKPIKVTLRFSTTTRSDWPVITIAGRSSDPSYLKALINELMSAHLADMKRSWDESAEGKLYEEVIQRVLLAQRELGSLKMQLEHLRNSDRPAAADAQLQLKLEEAEARWEHAKQDLSKLPPENEGEFPILEVARPEQFEHGLDPWSLVLWHPWRALASFILAFLLAVILIPYRQVPSVGAPNF